VAAPGFRLPAPAAYALSAVVHAAAFLALVRVEALAPPRADLVTVEVVEVAPPPPREEPPAPVPVPRRPAPRATPLAPPRDAPPPPARTEAPPPPNAPPPEDAPPPSKAPVRIGISMSSTTEGGVAAPVGNTLYGEVPRTAPDPAEVKPYRADKYVPPTQVTVLPRPSPGCFRTSAADYPTEAMRLEIEGKVVLSLRIDENGAIVDAKVVKDPGYGLGPAAIATLRRNGCRFDPAKKGGDAVVTTIPFTLTFQLP
jgi:periplasmic protein TonB